MVILLIIVSLAIFLFGLIQWARGGAALWSLRSLKKDTQSSNPIRRNRKSAEIHSAEEMADRFLRSSFKLLGILAIGMWLFLGVTVLLDLLGIDWISRLSSRARTFWGSSIYSSAPYNSTSVTTQSSAKRGNKILNSLRNSLKK